MRKDLAILRKMDIESAKLKIIQIITNTQSETLVSKILLFVTQFIEKPSNQNQENFEQENIQVEYDPLAIARIPTPESTSLEDLKRESGYDINKLREAHAQIDTSIWADEDLEELLAAI